MILALEQALAELQQEGGIVARHRRYFENQRFLVTEMRTRGYRTLLPDADQSVSITAFHNPTEPGFEFMRFYRELKARGFMIYPGIVSRADCFRIGTNGALTKEDIARLVAAVDEATFW